MSQNAQVIRLRYSWLSQGEVEILYSLLKNPFEVDEEVSEETDNSYVSLIHIEFPITYGKNFFKELGMDRWERIKDVLKNIKWRRGKKSLMLILQFSNPIITFSINSDDDKTFGKSLDTIEYLMDVILFQIDAKRLPTDATEIKYEFDEENFRWYPDKAIGNNVEYSYIN
ncbi:MAG: hypothetical protein ACE5J2_05380, partial [Nitrososphaerales archaeon]